MTNDDLQLDVAAELSWDPKVDSQAIAVSADEGTVTLRGTVGNLREKREAGKAAARVYRVTEVCNERQVRMLARRLVRARCHRGRRPHGGRVLSPVWDR